MKGTIYKIICTESNDVYIGSTLNKLRTRYSQHKTHYKNYTEGDRKGTCSIFKYFDKYGIDKFKCICIKEYDVVDRKHLLAYEQLWINKTKCINILSAFTPLFKALKKLYRERTKEHAKQYKKQYNQKHKDKIAKKNKQYRENNLEKIAKINKEYYEKNKTIISEKTKIYRESKKDEINTKQRAKIACEYCGNLISKTHKLRHHRENCKKSPISKEDRLKFIEQARQAQIDFKNTNKDKMKEYQQKRKIKIACDLCGNMVSKQHISRHKRESCKANK